MRRFVLCVVGVVALAVPIVAGQDEVPSALSQQQVQPKPVSTPPADKQEAPKPAAPEPPRQRGQLANVRLEVTITDQRGTGQPTTKTVALVLADRAFGRIRTTGEVPVQMKTPGDITNFQMRSIVLNVDARTELTLDGRVRAEITLEYKPTGSQPSADEPLPTTISESVAVILEDGKPLVVSQSADPNTDRRVRVEVKATILK